MRAALFVAMSLPLLGCSIDQGGVGVCVDRSPHFNGVTIDAWGVHLSTIQADAGITIGRYRQTFLYDPHLADGIRVTTRPTTAAREFRAPLATVGSTMGVNLQANKYRLGLSIGARWREALFLPSDFDGMVFFFFDSKDPKSLKLFRKELAK